MVHPNRDAMAVDVTSDAKVTSTAWQNGWETEAAGHVFADDATGADGDNPKEYMTQAGKSDKGASHIKWLVPLLLADDRVSDHR